MTIRPGVTVHLCQGLRFADGRAARSFPDATAGESAVRSAIALRIPTRVSEPDDIFVLHRAACQLAALVSPDEIGVGLMLGWVNNCPGEPITVAQVARLPNLANSAYPHKASPDQEARQRAWAFDWSLVDRLAEQEAWALAPVGLVHVHRHGKTLPSALDWRRGRAGMHCAIFHPGSGLLTFYRRGTTGMRGAYTGCVQLVYPERVAAPWRRFCAPPVDLEVAVARGVPPAVRMEVEAI